MSEFECKYGHLMSSRDRFCPVCAEEGRPDERVYRMDGLTGRQWQQREEYYKRMERKEADNG